MPASLSKNRPLLPRAGDVSEERRHREDHSHQAGAHATLCSTGAPEIHAFSHICSVHRDASVSDARRTLCPHLSMRSQLFFLAVTVVALAGVACGDPSTTPDVGLDMGESDSNTLLDAGVEDAPAGDSAADDAAVDAALDAGTDGSTPAPTQAGLFISVEQLARARERGLAEDEPYAAQYRAVRSRAMSALGETADPFRMDDVSTIRFGWSERPDGTDDTLSEAQRKFEDQGNDIRNLALWFALSGQTEFADHAVEMMLAWAANQTLVNMYDFNVDFAAGSFDGITEGFRSDRPWNFGLDAIWQAYGLIGVADAYLLLTRNGYALSEEDDTTLRDWLRRITEAVNSAFHCWTRWADAHPSSSSFERYRSDNHLSWAMAGLIAGAAALEDDALAAYVTDGGSWADSRAGEYANPSSIRDVIDRAIESGTGPENEGRVYEEQIGRSPPIGYSFFHLWAITLVTQVADLHFGTDTWTYVGDDGAGLELAFERYAAYPLGERASPDDEEDDFESHRWIFEMPYARFGSERMGEVLESGRGAYILQSIGPVALLLGE